MDNRLFEDQVRNIWQKRNGVWQPVWKHFYDFDKTAQRVKCYRDDLGEIDAVFCRELPGRPRFVQIDNPEIPREQVGTHVKVGRYSVRTYVYDDGFIESFDYLHLFPWESWERQVTWPHTVCDYKNITHEDAVFRSENRFPGDLGVPSLRFAYTRGSYFAPEELYIREDRDYYSGIRSQWCRIYSVGFGLVKYEFDYL